MRLPPHVARIGMLVGLATAAGCGLTLDVDPPDVLDAGSQPGFDAGALDAGRTDSGPLPCAEDADCADDLFCNGQETCVEGTCVPGSAPCDATPAPCAVSTCHESSRACIGSAVTCPSGQVCDPSTGECGAPPACETNTDCPDDGIECNGTFSCVASVCIEEAGACEAVDDLDCTTPTCTLDGCVELADDTLCRDTIPGDCVVPRCTESGCVEVAEDGLCDDGIPCTVDACDPLSARIGAMGCTHVPNDALCTATSFSACGSMVCVGDRALATYPTLAGCAPDLASERCPVSAPRCVVMDGTTSCEPVLGSCGGDADCRDGNPCNGLEACFMGACTQTTRGCPELLGSTSWCDSSTGAPTCAYRVDVDVTPAP